MRQDGSRYSVRFHRFDAFFFDFIFAPWALVLPWSLSAQRFPSGCLNVLVDLWFVNCTSKSHQSQGATRRERVWGINSAHFLVDVFVTLYKQTDLKVQTQIVRPCVGNRKRALLNWYLPVFCQWMKFACRIFLAEINWLLPDCEKTKQWKQHSMPRERMVFHHSSSTRREPTVADCNCITYMRIYIYIYIYIYMICICRMQQASRTCNNSSLHLYLFKFGYQTAKTSQIIELRNWKRKIKAREEFGSGCSFA